MYNSYMWSYICIDVFSLYSIYLISSMYFACIFDIIRRIDVFSIFLIRSNPTSFASKVRNDVPSSSFRYNRFFL